MKHKLALLFSCVLLGGLGPLAGSAAAQTKAYRQTNLSSSVPGFGGDTAPNIIRPWAIAFLKGQPFLVAENGAGVVSAHDSAGMPSGVIALPVPVGDSSRATPTGIVSDASNAFGPRTAPFQYVVVTQDGTLSGFSIANGKIPSAATLAKDESAAGAVFTSLALLHPGCCAPFVAVANFHDGLIHTFTSTFDPLAGPSSFNDPKLPAGYAPYGMQVIGRQLFVTYALQDAAKRDPLPGAGNGIVDVFDLQGNFVRRFATGGALNAPWGVAQASANFGPFSDAILVGNSGDGTIVAFDAGTGNFLGQLKDGDGSAITNPGIRGLSFRADGLADPNTLFFTAGAGNGQNSLIGAITPGLVSTARVSVSPTHSGASATITTTVAAGPGNPGTPTGLVTIHEGGVTLTSAPLNNGIATFDAMLTGAGIHTIGVRYSGDAAFLPSNSQTEAQVRSPAASGSPDFTLAANPSSLSVRAGQSGNVTLTVTSSNGFTGSVTLSCSPVSGITCTFNPAAVTVSTAMASGTSTLTLTVSSGGPGGYVHSHQMPGFGGPGALLGALLLFSFGLARGWKSLTARPRVLAGVAVLLLFVLSLALVGCGYNSNYTPPANRAPVMVTVTAQSGMLSHSTTVTVMVQ